MNRKYIAFPAGLVLVVLFITAHVKDTYGQRTPRTIEFSKIRDHLDEYKMRRGDQFVVPNVPLTGQTFYDKVNKIYSYRAGDRDDRGHYYTFYTSPALAKALRQHLDSDSEPEVSVTLYCTFVEFVDGDYVNSSPFVTKAEAFDRGGKLVWTETGPPPLKLRMQ